MSTSTKLPMEQVLAEAINTIGMDGWPEAYRCGLDFAALLLENAVIDPGAKAVLATRFGGKVAYANGRGYLGPTSHERYKKILAELVGDRVPA